MMYRIDVYAKHPKKGSSNKKISSHWYPTFKEADNAKYALENMPRKEYTFVPGENRKPVTKTLGGYTVSKPTKDNKF